LVELKPTDITPFDSSEIPAYVIQPPRQHPHAYQAPRLSRSSLRDLVDSSPRTLWPQRLAQKAVSLPTNGEDQALGEMRFRAQAVRYQVDAPRNTKVQAVLRGAASILLVSVFAALVWWNQPLEPVSSGGGSTISTDVLIARQNLAAKLSTVDAFAKGLVSDLEAGSRASNIIYTVQPGDDFAAVGARFGLKPRTVRLVNLLPLGARLTPGQRLVITPGDGAYHQVRSGETLRELAERYRVPLDVLTAQNPHIRSSVLRVDSLLFIPGATEVRARKAVAVRHRGYRTRGGWTDRLKVSRSLVGAFGSRVGDLSWPASGQMSSPFGVRGYSFHPGVDICNVVGTPIRAAKGGVVQSAGWMGAYGYAVDIDHGAGVITRYAHCSRVLVSAGESVGVGQEIAKMGSTGRSTGPHLHFEVRLQGRAVNPAGFF